MNLVAQAKRLGYLKAPCKECGQVMVVKRSGGKCLNCGAGRL